MQGSLTRKSLSAKRAYSLSCVIMLAILSSLASQEVLAQEAKTREAHAVSCQSEGETLEFVFIDRTKASLRRIEGPTVNSFSDLQERDWTVRFVLESGAPFFHMENAKGAKLELMIPVKTTRTIGTLTWNDPPGARVDLLCDFSTALPWQW